MCAHHDRYAMHRYDRYAMHRYAMRRYTTTGMRCIDIYLLMFCGQMMGCIGDIRIAILPRHSLIVSQNDQALDASRRGGSRSPQTRSDYQTRGTDTHKGFVPCRGEGGRAVGAAAEAVASLLLLAGGPR